MKILLNKINLFFYSPVYLIVDPTYSGLNEKFKRLLDLETWMEANGAVWEHPERGRYRGYREWEKLGRVGLCNQNILHGKII